MANIVFKKAERRKTKARIAIAGVSGVGKTFTSLLIAKELGERIAVVDSEHGSASKYEGEPGIPEFDVVELDSFSPERYIECIRAAEQAGYDVLLIDSISHAWMGKEGLLEQVDKTVERGKSGFSEGWRKASPLHSRMIDAMLQSKLHLIVTMRMKGKYVIEENDRGKQVPKKVGLEMQQRDGFEFEFDIVGEMDLDHHLVITKSRCSKIDGLVLVKPDASLGREIAAWLNKGVEASEPTPAPALEPSVSVEDTQQTLLAIQDQLAALAGNGPMAKMMKQALCAEAFGEHIRTWDDVKALSYPELSAGLNRLKAKASKSVDIDVKLGIEPFTYETSDGTTVYQTVVDGDTKSCNCGPAGKSGTCHHIAAVEAYCAKS